MTALRCAAAGRGALLVRCLESVLARGHSLALVVTRDAEARRWAAERGIAIAGEPSALAAAAPLDLLLSIQSDQLLPEEALASASLAVNFHDAPLPRYAGFFAPTWALLAREREHGVTWHEMTARADAGAVLVQSRFPLAPDDTAFTLSGKAYEAALASLDELLDELAAGTLAPRAQDLTLRTSFPRARRPAREALLSFARPPEELDAVARALDFGPSPNPLALPKLALPSGFAAFRTLRILAARSGAPAGTVLEAAEGVLRVATSGADVELTGVVPLGDARAPAKGDVAAEPSEALLDALAAFDRKVARSEEIFAARLRELAPAPLPASATPRETASADTRVPLALPEERRDAASRAVLLGAVLARLRGLAAVDVAVGAAVTPELAGLYVRAVPLRVDIAGTFDDARRGAAAGLDELARLGTYARDLLLRDATLAPPSLPAAIADDSPAPEGAALALAPDALLHDERVLDRAAAEALARQLETLARASLAEPKRALADLPIRSEEERRVVAAANDTAAPYDARRVEELVLERAAAHPERTALVFRNTRVAYGELARRVDAIAAALAAAGVRRETRVAVFLARSENLVPALLGVLRAGGAYVPLDPSYPADRLRRTLDATEAPVVLTSRALAASLPAQGGRVVLLEDALLGGAGAPGGGLSVEDLAYVLFTSGSTGRPKGVMVTHRNLAALFAGLDRLLTPAADAPGVFLAATSIAFDISALELLWTLARGFTVVVQEEDRLGSRAPRASASRPVDFSLFYFAAEAGASSGAARYRLLLDGARFADAHGFRAVWTPERHFHSFGGLYPNPSVTGAALAAATSRVGIRAGSVVMPLHDPIRVAEEWSVVDNLSGGRAGVSFASGWHATDFALAPDRYADRKDAMLRGIETVRRLWRGEAVSARSGDGSAIEVRLMPPPVQKELPFWLTAAGNVETFRAAGALGANLLTNLLGQDAAELAAKIRAYREAWRDAGHAGEGIVTLMLHTFLGDDEAEVRETVRAPFSSYLATSFDLIRMAPTAFPAFRQPSRAAEGGGFDPARFTDEDRDALVAHAFSRYVESSGLFGTPRSVAPRVEALRDVGVDELACLVDFGVAEERVLGSLSRLDALRAAFAGSGARPEEDFSLAAQVRRHGVTHLQLTPSLARLLLADPAAKEALSRLSVLLVGGEALPVPLARELRDAVRGRVVDVYGPTETTVWSSASEVAAPVARVTLGRPLANETLHVLDAERNEAPLGATGELAIGGEGLARGYLGDAAATDARFVAHPELGRLYLTGDVASRLPDGELLFHGRADDQVKVAGHRVELGEIEAALASVPGVAAAAAAVRDDEGTPRLVAYVVRGGAPSREGAWRTVWDETYRTRSGGDAPHLAGWRSAVTGAPIPREEMDEWIETTVARIRALLADVRHPARVLEIGCGAGLLLSRLAPGCALYEGWDLSEEALRLARERLDAAPIPSVRLAMRAAEEVAGVAPGSFDLVIVNSVAQYFPDAAYLVRVLEGASRALAPGGAVFLGDLKSLSARPLLAFEAELSRAPATLEAARLAERASARAAADSELAMDPALLGALGARLETLGGAVALVKRGRAANELTRWRWDAVLRFGAAPELPLARAVHASRASEIGALLAEAPAALRVTDIPDPRSASVVAAWERAPRGGTAAELRELASRAAEGVAPDELVALNAAYDVTPMPAASGTPGRYDALFRRRAEELAPAGESLAVLPLPPAVPLDACVSRPAPAHAAGLEAEIVAALRERLPAALVPSAIVVLDALPLTPNGKLDRKALPAPSAAAPTAAAAPRGEAPEGALEETIAAVWRGLLGTDHVPRDVNFFDLGANSLLMLEATARLSSALSRETSLVTMFRFPSVKALAEHLSRGEESGSDETGAVARSRSRGEKRREARERRRPTAAEVPA